MNLNQAPPLQPSGKTARAFSSLKKALRRQLASQFEESLHPALLRRVLDEAEELSQSTGFPHLFFPILAEEQVRRIVVFTSEPPPGTTRSAVDLHSAA
jgi:hypothetical protein